MDAERLRDAPMINLAYLGDAVFTLIVREELVIKGGKNSAMNAKSRKIVSAVAQSEFYTRLLPVLSEEEANIMRRGRNTSVKNRTNSANASAYHRATGVEALFGWLYLKGEKARIAELYAVCVEKA